MAEYNEEEKDWIEALSKDVASYIENSGWKSKDISSMFNFPQRDMLRVVNGLKETHLSMVKTEIYAILYFHCGLPSADPRFIPNDRAWTQAEYQSWRKKQNEPLLINPLQAWLNSFSEFRNLLDLILMDETSSNIVSFAARREISDIKQAIELLSGTEEERKRAIEMMRLLSLEEGQK